MIARVELIQSPMEVYANRVRAIFKCSWFRVGPENFSDFREVKIGFYVTKSEDE